MAPLVMTGIFYLALTALCLIRPNAGRVFVGAFFWVMALGVHGYFIIANPQSYVDFAHNAYLGFYRDLASPVVELSPRGFGVLMLGFEVAVGALILNKRRAVKLGLLAGIVFLLGITPLKYTQVNPILAVGLAYLLTKDFRQSLPELLRDRLVHREPPRMLA